VVIRGLRAFSLRFQPSRPVVSTLRHFTMTAQPSQERRICGIPVVLTSFIFILITTILSVLESFIFADCGSALALIVQCLSLITTIAGVVAFFNAVLRRSARVMMIVLFATFYGLLQSIMIILSAVVTSTGSESCISNKVRSWNTTCADDATLTCDVFNDHVKNMHGGNLDEVIVEFSIFVGIYALILFFIYTVSYVSHYAVVKSLIATKRLEEAAQHQVEAQTTVDCCPPKYNDILDFIPPLPSYDHCERIKVEGQSIQPPPYETHLAETNNEFH
ncbi:hypothetical protein PENTCL1PPCAC_14555, partial [Pristionchus entomophagus]